MSVVELQVAPNDERVVQDLTELLAVQRQAYRSDSFPSVSARIVHLKLLKKLLLDNQEALMAAMAADFSARSRDEIRMIEFIGMIHNINYMCKKLKGWMKPEKRSLPLHMQPGKAQLIHQPLGVVGIMVPFNFPISLACSPLATALAAGNRAMIKMPEATPRTSALFAQLIKDKFPEDLVTVVNGEADVAEAFSYLSFDHLIYTGSGAVGRRVMRAAAENLTPVTLELGGKSPVVIDHDMDIVNAAEKICFGKSVNSGQICVAPDYILLPRERIESFVEAYRASFNKFYPKISNNPDYTALISDRHNDRISGLLEDAKSKGAKLIPLSDEVVNDGSRRRVPVLVTGVSDDMLIMREEIFGPALPLIPYDTLDQAIDYINDRDRPLALYYFGGNSVNQQRLLYETHSGGVTVNELLLQAAVDDMPFGGVGDSGMGHYHGREGFLTFSKAKSVVIKPKFNGMKMLYPPYRTKFMNTVFKFLLR